MQNENIKKLDGLAVISIDLDIWSGQTKLQDIDLRLADEYNNEVVNLGNKRLVSRESLKPFERLKSTVRRNMLRRGIQFLNGYAVPVDQLDEAIEEIEGWRVQFEDAVMDFMATYHGNVESWVAQNPEDEEVIRRGTLPLEAVEKRFGFTWDAFQIQGVMNNEAAQSQLDSSAGQLGNKLIADVQQTARDFWDRNLKGRSMVGITCQATLREMKRKLESLAFLDRRSKPLIELLDRVILQSERAESRTGRNFVDPFFSQLVASTLILADRTRMQEYLDGYHDLPETAPEKQVEQGGLFAEAVQEAQAQAKSEKIEPEQVEAEPINTVEETQQEVKPVKTDAPVETTGDAFLDALAEMAGLHGEFDIEVKEPQQVKQEETQAVEPVVAPEQVEVKPEPAPEPEPVVEAKPQPQPQPEPELAVLPEQPVTQTQPEPEPAPVDADFGFGFNSSNAIGW